MIGLGKIGFHSFHLQCYKCFCYTEQRSTCIIFVTLTADYTYFALRFCYISLYSGKPQQEMYESIYNMCKILYRFYLSQLKMQWFVNWKFGSKESVHMLMFMCLSVFSMLALPYFGRSARK